MAGTSPRTDQWGIIHSTGASAPQSELRRGGRGMETEDEVSGCHPMDRRPYDRPRLLVLGDLADLTNSGTTTGTDGGGVGASS